MESRFRILVFMLAVIFAGEVFAQSPVTNMRVQRIDTVIVVFYDLAATANVEAHASLDNGVSFIGPLQHVTGAVGNNVLSGKDKILIWHVVSEIGEEDASNVLFRLVTGAEQTSSVLVDGNLIARGRKVYQYDLELINDLVLVGNRAYQFRAPLTTTEVRNIMANSNALIWYDKGIKRNRNGNIWMIAGGGLAAAGGIIMLTRPFEKKYSATMWSGYQREVQHGRDTYKRYGSVHFNDYVNVFGSRSSFDFSERWGYDYPYDFYLYNDDISLDIGFFTAVAGVAVIGTGAILKLLSRYPIQRSVDFYNSNKRPLSRLEYDFNFTGNGAHLAIRF